MKLFKCLFGKHEWQMSPFVALGAPPGEYSVQCKRCGKWEHRLVILGQQEFPNAS